MLMQQLIRQFQKRPFLFLLLTSPFVVWLSLKPVSVMKEWVAYPHKVVQTMSGFFSTEKLTTINEMRWDSFSDDKDDLYSRLYYNKGMLLINDFFEYTTYLSPRLYFYSGDQTSISQGDVEPILGALSFFWFFGLIEIIQKRKYWYLIIIFLISALTFAAGSKNIAYLFPVYMIYFFFSYKGNEVIASKKIRWLVLKSAFLLNLFLLGRVVWLMF